MTENRPDSAWRMTLSGWWFGWRAIRAMPLLLRTTISTVLLLEIVDTYLGKPHGLSLRGDAGPLLWSTYHALLNGCLAASTEIAVFRFVLLNEASDRPVWLTPPGFQRYVAVGLVLGGAFATLTNAIRYLPMRAASPLTLLFCLAFGGLLAVTLTRSVTLFRTIVAEASGCIEDISWQDIRPHVWRMAQVLLWQMGIGVALMVAFALLGSALPDAWRVEGKLLTIHAGAMFLAVASPYAFAASFSVLYRRIGETMQPAVITLQGGGAGCSD